MADLLPVTGVLLLGGASERFGSPKALASFRGETLADRSWRVLNDACEEVLAVGKADRDEFPFPVLDDGVEEHAPIHGLIAGLRAASNNVCVALPVDCPLVTSDLLRALAATRTVPQTGPLPGAYDKGALPELEARVARGELSLRGVNPIVLDVDEALLLNVNTRLDLIAAGIAEWASEREDVRAALVVGSQARRQLSADRWSDLDAVLFADYPRALAAETDWVENFGTPVLTFLEETGFGSGVERRVLYESGEDVDFPIVDATAWREVAALPETADMLSRGYRVLYDELELGKELARLARPLAPRPPNVDAFGELVSDFWYHALWAAKKLRRGEVFTAMECLDGYMKSRVLTLLRWHARAVDPSVDTWHSGRFLERWADPGALAALQCAYAHYELRDVARALWETIDLFQGLSEETAQRLGHIIELDQVDLRRRVGQVVPDPRRA